MFEYFYHEILRKTIISCGSLFNDIVIKHKNNSEQIVSEIKVPLSYGPSQKFLARLEQSPDLNKPVQMTLPRMSFEFIGLTYDATRKVTTTQSFITSLSSNKTDIRKSFMPVPYNMQFELNVMTKINDDMLQIIEQILPYFQPSYNMSLKLIDEIDEKRDIPIVLEGITMTDDYEGDFSTRRALIYTLRFTAKIYLFGPISNAENDIIKNVSIGFMSANSPGKDSKTTGKDITYSSSPRALKSYTNNIVTTLSTDIDTSEYLISVVNASTIPSGSYITINDESMYVKSKSNNTLTVVRGSDSTQISNHVSGTAVKLITIADNNLIEIGDDFGFNGSIL